MATTSPAEVKRIARELVVPLVQGQEIVLHTVTRFLDEGRWSVVSCPRS